MVPTMDPFEATRELADVQRRLAELPADACEERYRLPVREDELRGIAGNRGSGVAIDQGVEHPHGSHEGGCGRHGAVWP